MTSSATLRIGTRGSPLALAQAEELRRRLGEAGCTRPCEIVVIHTTGDKVLDRPLAEIGGKGLFTKEIDEALLDGRIDVAVHSMKDVPTVLPDGIVLGAVLPREDCRDAFLSRGGLGLAELPPGAVVGTASLRRGAQILLKRPDLVVRPLRGNVQTRLKRLAEGAVDATVLAMAGLNRLGLAHVATAALSPETMLPAVAQGAIGIAARAADEAALAALMPLDHAASRRAVAAERAFLAKLDGSCRTPIAALAEAQGDGLFLRGLVLETDGGRFQAVAMAGSDPVLLGTRAGEDVLARLPRDFRGLTAGRD